MRGATYASVVGVLEKLSTERLTVRCSRKQRRDGKLIEKSTWIEIVKVRSTLLAGCAVGHPVLVECRIRSSQGLVQLVATRVIGL